MMIKRALMMAGMLLTGCATKATHIMPVQDFELDRYLGTWYEIARLDHSFERGMSKVTANYSLREDGGVQVINKGYLADKDKWKTAEGKAYFVGEPDVAHLKVSFFGPFYGAYIITELDKSDYQYALIAGPNHDYLWILSRTPQLDKGIIDKLLTQAEQQGYDTDALIFVEQ